MIDISPPVVFLPGAGGGFPDWAVFTAGEEDSTSFVTIQYPNWRRLVAEELSAELLVSELTSEILKLTRGGPIRIIGLSLGGHFGYAVALRLQSMGRQITGLCAIDTFMISSAELSPGWKGRKWEQGMRLLRRGSLLELAGFFRTLFWRGLIRLAGDKVPSLLRRLSLLNQGRAIFALDPTLENEMSMRLLLREVAPWVPSLDRAPVALNAPTVLRTNLTVADDPAWRRRCTNLRIAEIIGNHQTLFEPEYVHSLHDAFVAATPEWRRNK